MIKCHFYLRQDAKKNSVKYAELKRFDRICFPSDELITSHDIKQANWWVLTVNKEVAGYCSMRINMNCGEYIGYFTRAGVLTKFRGKGYQRKMIKARVAYAKRQGVERVVTYTLTDNCPSSNNLIRCGFTTYNPQTRWVGKYALYWEKV